MNKFDAKKIIFYKFAYAEVTVRVISAFVFL